MSPEVLFLVFIVVLLDSVEHMLFRMAGHYPERYWAYAVPAITLYGAGIGLWLWILRSVPIGIATPMMGSSYVVTAFLSKLFFKEDIDARRWCGICVIVVGVALLAGERPL